ncbi:protein translocase subunit yidC [Robiginitalea myxolifaciens]|uniref:Membrane protein insertase YidC n=1 Tax=Robiginitalea myxolifaciens TaxID=400055 RepID=A0A1I6H503_9FLAO|nr:membrane protein insertase YidC [Robiginitalea myxolifaciens]SFR49500.1 protein translocase subunit yidC [Robiginitalea myxolifaciens]
MEEKKLDLNSIIGFVLIFLILIGWFWMTKPSPEELAAEKERQEQVQDSLEQLEAQNNPIPEVQPEQTVVLSDSAANAAYRNRVGAFAFTETTDGETTLENDLLFLEISNKGGQITEARMKQYVTFDSIPVYLIKDGNASFNLVLTTNDNRVLQTRDMYFQPELTQDNGNQVLSMKAKAGPQQFLEFRYTLKPGEYLLDFDIRSQGLASVLASGDGVPMQWEMKGIRHNKSVMYENRYTRLTYRHEGEDISKLSESSDLDEETEVDVRWMSFRQHFFSSILAVNQPLASVDLKSANLVEEESRETEFTKEFGIATELPKSAGELASSMHWYYGPTDIDTLEQYEDLALADSIPYGWGIFGWINRYLFTPFFGFLSSFLPYGIAIVVMTILVRILLSPVTYKSYLSQAKMRVLKPEITEINEKHKDNAMKRQQETMKLYNKAGVSPLSGCIPALLQLPIFYALFMFFPTSFALRQKSFLWAEDLSSYDTIAQLPFTIPFYGDHVSLFPILASVAIFFYMMMTTGQQMQTQPGMPNMKFIMYLSPLLMLFFFNNYASGLSLYYFVSNLITIGIMLVIKNVILDENKIHAQIEQKKKQPKKENRFQKKMREMMEEAEKQKKKK